ncbi:MAG: hypothetical protein KC620_13020 [Myxococcales bacterium]|nr:hypothetical protein [Myxococcales bacterium]
MYELKKLLAFALSLSLAFAVAACDVDDDEADGGVDGGGGMGGEGGAGGEGGGATYQYVIILDESEDENMNGTPGVDVCGMTADCGGMQYTGDSATLREGSGLICDGTTREAPCESGTNRKNPMATLDTGSACEPLSSPSDYASIGLGGELAVMFGVDLQGCTVTINEVPGGSTPNETYSVYICQTDMIANDTCVGGGSLDTIEMGGQGVIDVPAAPAN